MIARQRQNLKHTFAALHLENVSAGSTQRFAKTEREILAATRELAEGLAARGAPVPPLETASVAMQSAADSLAAGDLKNGMSHQEAALAHLVSARQNIRQILKTSPAAQAAECRSFDRQQNQKLRLPDPREQRRSVAQLREQLEQLAEQQRRWSEEVQPPSAGSPPQDRTSQASPEPSPSRSEDPAPAGGDQPGEQSQPAPSELAVQQRQAVQAAERLREQLNTENAATDLARQRMGEAAGSIRDSLEALDANHAQEAAMRAAQAARELDRLSDHLANLNAADFAERLAAGHQLARSLAEGEQELAASALEEKPASDGLEWTTGMADQQRQLARRGEELADLLSRLAGDSLDEDPQIGRMLSEVTDVDPPAEAVQLMRSAAAEFESRQTGNGSRLASMAARTLGRLAEGLAATRDRYVQPRLDELLAAEQRAAQLAKDLSDARSETERALVRSQLDDLLRALRRLAAGDERIERALESFAARGAVPAAAAESGGQPAHDTGLHELDQLDVTALGRITRALQTRIQEAILAGALADPDAAVPLPYRGMVDEYYRTLSEDLRE